ncbi:phosphate/phosphite/phosphonate ABC transporter substrate-binding protein, partial [Halorubrum sp. CBA1125]|uniref:phosphate/phosphite/phosphonate ABC transporter substrate-binding protein n=1 Tax=Halorubrum sp. CBA1125 TaxID=2668072 RepID=UPI001E5D4C82
GGDGGDGGDGGSGNPKEVRTDPEAFDFANPNWEENNWTLAPLIENNYHRGSQTDLEEIEPRDEVRYGDPVQELGEDEEPLDPDTLVFSWSPSEETPAQYESALQPIMNNVEEETGKDTEFRPLTSYAATVEAMRAEQLHICNFNTGAVPFAVNIAGAVPEAIGLPDDPPLYGYRLWAITQADNEEIWSVDDFAGKNVAHSEPTSNSGNQAPRALFEQEFDLIAGEDYEVNYSGGHDQTTRGVAVGDYDCGPVCSSCAKDVIEASGDELQGSDIKAVWASQPFPNGPFAYRYNLHPDIVEGFQRALYDYDYAGTEWERGSDYARHVEIEYKTHWDIILTIQKFNGVEYNLNALSE